MAENEKKSVHVYESLKGLTPWLWFSEKPSQKNSLGLACTSFSGNVWIFVSRKVLCPGIKVRFY